MAESRQTHTRLVFFMDSPERVQRAHRDQDARIGRDGPGVDRWFGSRRQARVVSGWAAHRLHPIVPRSRATKADLPHPRERWTAACAAYHGVQLAGSGVVESGERAAGFDTAAIRNGTPPLAALDLGTLQVRLLTKPPPATQFGAPGDFLPIAPDDRTVAFVRETQRRPGRLSAGSRHRVARAG